eukprot:TRINITY_DN4376_c0_g1_i6.p1 TRINITY_DN4376_c0_g1~~TRINITY_DN4376_c0_g1_i6.p1  ORF type:complete len:858 (-),score=184.16 TRINITY_DN4376_c0_g1_i6:292-2598(-)
MFVWNYVTGADCVQWTQPNHGIIGVALVRAKYDFQVPGIEHLLVVASPNQITLLGVAFENNDPHKALVLYPTPYIVPSNNIAMCLIRPTDAGRIFLFGEDLNVYELLYQPDDGWFHSKCRLVCQSSSVLTAVVPTFVASWFTTPDTPRDMIVDNDRHLLYTLTARGRITLYSLAPRGQGFARVAECVRTLREIKSSAGVLDTAQNDEYLSLHTVPKAESETYDLVALTKAGYRIFFRTRNLDVTPGSDGRSLQAVSTVLLAENVVPPPEKLARTLVLGFSAFGTLLVEKAGAEIRLITISPNPAALKSNSPTDKAETFSTMRLTEMPGCIAEHRVDIGASVLQVPPSFIRNELSVPHAFPPREFLLLTAKGIIRVQKLRPVDELLQALKDYTRDQNESRIKALFDEYGRDQLCSMCLDIACSDVGTAAGSFMTPHDRDLARQFFQQHGGAPKQDSKALELGSVASVFGVAVLTSAHTQFSGIHNGLILYFTRITRAVWNARLFGVKRKANSEQSYVLALSPKQIHDTKNLLTQLYTFVATNYPAWSSPPRSVAPTRAEQAALGGRGGAFMGGAGALAVPNRSVSSRPDAEREEHTSLHAFSQLLPLCLQALHFLFSISPYFTRLVEECKKRKAEIPEKLEQLTFQQLVNSSQGLKFVGVLVHALVSSNVENNEALLKKLQVECPLFVTTRDYQEYLGHEALDKCKDLPMAAEAQRTANLSRALSRFLEVIDEPEFELSRVCEKFLEYKCGGASVGADHKIRGCQPPTR